MGGRPDLLQSRECVEALWLQHRYALATHGVLAVGMTLDGHRRILGLVESAPEDVERIAAFLDDLQAHGVRAESRLLCTVPSPDFAILSLHLRNARVNSGLSSQKHRDFRRFQRENPI